MGARKFMKILAVTHAAFESLGVIEDWIKQKEHHLKTISPYQGDPTPQYTNDFDFLIIMGGPQSPLKLDKYPYIKDEIELCKLAIQNNKLVLGICLGAQIIGEALGATTAQSPNKEIGEFPVFVTEAGKSDPFFKHLYPSFSANHWHNDMPGLTDDMELLAKSEGCPNQAFKYKEKVYGFQFHLEPTLKDIEGFIQHAHGDLKAGKYVRSINELRATNYSAINKNMFRFLDYMESKFSDDQ